MEFLQSMPEVISTKWLVLAVLLLFGVKAGATGLKWARQASTGMLVAAMLFFSGLGGASWSIGDVASNWATPPASLEESSLEKGQFSNAELVAFVSNSGLDQETIRSVLSYKAVQDGKAVVVVDEDGKPLKVHRLKDKVASADAQLASASADVETKSDGTWNPFQTASLTEEVESEVSVEAAPGPNLPIQWSFALAGCFAALAVIGVVVAGRTANKIRAEGNNAA